MLSERPHDLSKFDALNALDAEAKKKPKERKKIAEQRRDLIREQFPSTEKLNWKAAFDRDRDLFNRIWRDMVKLGEPQAGRPGPRPSLDYEDGIREYRKLSGQDYAMVPFDVAFRELANGLSFTVIARKVDLDRNLVYRLITGQKAPDIYVIRQIAKAFRKDPSFFLEYRLHYVASAMVQRMSDVPEASVNIYRKIFDGNN